MPANKNDSGPTDPAAPKGDNAILDVDAICAEHAKPDRSFSERN